MRLFHLLMAAFFLSCAALQWNDPDPVPWMSVYTVAAVLTLTAQRLPKGPLLCTLVAATALSWAAMIAPGARGANWAEVFGAVSMKTEAVEVARETAGLLIVAAWLFGRAVALRRRRALRSAGGAAEGLV